MSAALPLLDHVTVRGQDEDGPAVGDSSRYR